MVRATLEVLIALAAVTTIWSNGQRDRYNPNGGIPYGTTRPRNNPMQQRRIQCHFREHAIIPILEGMKVPSLKIHQVYYLLAGLDLLMLCISLLINRQNTLVFRNSVENNQEFIRHVEEVEEFAARAAKTNAPGNDVFDSKDPKKERKNLQAVQLLYEEKKQNLLADYKATGKTKMTESLTRVSAAIDAMLLEAEGIFTAFERGKESYAASRMATMDRRYAEVGERLREYRKELVNEQNKELSSQFLRTKELGNYERFLAGCLLLLVTAIAIYGHRLGRKITASEQLIQKQEFTILDSNKMSTLGSFAGTIVHEINNPLTVISGKTAIIRMNLEKKGVLDESLLQQLGAITQMISRIELIIRGVKNLSYGGNNNEVFEKVSFTKLFNETIVLLQGKIKSSGAILKVVPFEDFTLECQPVQLSQVMINLVNNAADAVSSLPEKWIQINVLLAGNAVQISVTDSGKGIPPEIREKLFSNFFTTKGRGKGTGIGLTLSRRITEQHHGKFEYRENFPNTQFVITLPLTQPATTRTGEMAKAELNPDLTNKAA